MRTATPSVASLRSAAVSTRASDVAQEVFLRFWLHPERFDPSRGSLRTYLLTVGRSVAIDAARSDAARRRPRGGGDTAGGAPPGSIDDGLLSDEAAERVRSALLRLPRLERDAIATAFYGGCSYRAAAVVLGESEGTVKSRIRAGLHRLRELLDAQVLVALDGVSAPTPLGVSRALPRTTVDGDLTLTGRPPLAAPRV